MHIGVDDDGAGEENEQKRSKADVARAAAQRIREDMCRRFSRAIEEGEGEVEGARHIVDPATDEEARGVEMEGAIGGRKALLAALRARIGQQAKRRKATEGGGASEELHGSSVGSLGGQGRRWWEVGPGGGEEDEEAFSAGVDVHAVPSAGIAPIVKRRRSAV